MNEFLKMFGFYRSMSCVFEGATGNDANNTNADGGDTGTKVNVGGGAAKDDTTPKTFELTVDGQKKVVTLDEMKTMAQKSAGADAKFQQASELRNSAQNGIRLQELISRVNDPNQQPSDTDIKEIASIMGIDPTGFVAEYKQALGDGTNNTTTTTNTKGNVQDLSADFQRVFQDQFGITPAEAKQRMDYWYQKDIKEAKQDIIQESNKIVDKDEIFGKMIIGDGGKVNKDRLAVIQNRVAEEIIRGLQDGKPFTAELKTAAIQKVRAELTQFGILNKPDRYPVTLGFGPGNGLPIEVPIDKPVERVNTVDDNSGDNFIKRIAQKVAKGRLSRLSE